MSDVLKNAAERILGLDAVNASGLVEKFIERQELRQKSWENKGDVLAHFISWSEKHQPRQQPTRTRTRTDTEARVEERQRAEEEQKRMNELDKARYQLETYLRQRAEFEKAGRTDLVQLMEKPIRDLYQKLGQANKKGA